MKAEAPAPSVGAALMFYWVAGFFAICTADVPVNSAAFVGLGLSVVLWFAMGTWEWVRWCRQDPEQENSDPSEHDDP